MGSCMHASYQQLFVRDHDTTHMKFILAQKCPEEAFRGAQVVSAPPKI